MSGSNSISAINQNTLSASKVEKKDIAVFNGKTSQPQVNEEQKNLTDLKNQPKRTQQDVDKAFESLIKDAGGAITLQELKKIIALLRYEDNTLLCMDSAQFNQFKVCITNALMYLLSTPDDENLDAAGNKAAKQKLFKEKLAAFAFYIAHSGYSVEEAQKKVDNIDSNDLFSLLARHIQENKELSAKFGGKDVSELSEAELKEIFKNYIIGNLNQKEAKDPKAFLNFFVVAINKCNDAQKSKIFAAFALLLKDAQLGEQIKDAFIETAVSFADANQLQSFLNGKGKEALTKLGFSVDTIQTLQAMAYQEITPDMLGKVYDSIQKFLSEFTAEDIKIIFKVKTALEENPEAKIEDILSGEEKNKYDKRISQFGDVIQKFNDMTPAMVASGRNDLSEETKGKAKKIYDKATELDISDCLYNDINNFVLKNQDRILELSKPEITQNINKLTDNQFSKVTGDKENMVELDKKQVVSDKTETVGLEQKLSASECAAKADKAAELKSKVTTTDDKPAANSVVNASQSKVDFLFENKTSVNKTQVIRNVEHFTVAKSKGLITIDDAGKDFNNACQSVQNKVISYLDEQKNRILDILNQWGNSELMSFAANKYNFNKDQIDELEVSIGTKLVMENLYNQKHKIEEGLA